MPIVAGLITLTSHALTSQGCGGTTVACDEISCVMECFIGYYILDRWIRTCFCPETL